MDLLERYLAAVARQLPDAQKADVTDELRDLLMSQIEEKEAALRRPLAREELEALLIAFGNPIAVAGRYRRVQQLIGPTVFPYWWAALKATLGVVAAIYLVLVIVSVIAGGQAAEVADQVKPSLTVALLFTFGAVTAVFALLERFGGDRVFDKWRPRDLPPVKGRGRSVFEIVTEIGMEVVFILWWIGAISFHHVIPDGIELSLAPVWREFFWPILGYSVFELVINLMTLARPGMTRQLAALSLAKNLAGIGILAYVAQAGHWVEVGGERLSWQAQSIIQVNFDIGVQIGLAITLVVMLVRAAFDVRRLFTGVAIGRPVGV